MLKQHRSRQEPLLHRFRMSAPAPGSGRLNLAPQSLHTHATAFVRTRKGTDKNATHHGGLAIDKLIRSVGSPSAAFLTKFVRFVHRQRGRIGEVPSCKPAARHVFPPPFFVYNPLGCRHTYIHLFRWQVGWFVTQTRQLCLLCQALYVRIDTLTPATAHAPA